MSQKIDLTGEQVVAGNLKDKQQLYQIFYYPRERTLTDKVWIYFHQATNEKKFAIKSLCFSSIEQLETFIINLSKSYFYFIDHRIQSDIPLPDFRKIRLRALLAKIEIKQLEEWKNHS